MLTSPCVNNPNKHNMLSEKGRRNLHIFPPLQIMQAPTQSPSGLLQQQWVTLKPHQKPEYISSSNHVAHILHTVPNHRNTEK